MMLALGSALFLSIAVAQTHQQPGQVKMQIPLGGPSAPGRPGAPAAGRPVQAGAKAPNNVPAGNSNFPFPTGQNVPTAPVSQVFSSDAGMDSLLTEELIRSLRDPFAPPAILQKKEAPRTELETIALKDFRLNGIITGPKKVRAMLTGPGAKTYFVAVGDKVGIRQGRITSIQPDLIKVVEYDIDDRGRRVPEVFEVRISGEIVSLSKKDEE